jgi:hypothetical protein
MPFTSSRLQGCAHGSQIPGELPSPPAHFKHVDAPWLAWSDETDGKNNSVVEFGQTAEPIITFHRKNRADVTRAGVSPPSVETGGERATRKAIQRRIETGEPVAPCLERSRALRRWADIANPRGCKSVQRNNNAHKLVSCSKEKEHKWNKTETCQPYPEKKCGRGGHALYGS